MHCSEKILILFPLNINHEKSTFIYEVKSEHCSSSNIFDKQKHPYNCNTEVFLTTKKNFTTDVYNKQIDWLYYTLYELPTIFFNSQTQQNYLKTIHIEILLVQRTRNVLLS
jgi:hypothetical protein